MFKGAMVNMSAEAGTLLYFNGSYYVLSKGMSTQIEASRPRYLSLSLYFFKLHSYFLPTHFEMTEYDSKFRHEQLKKWVSSFSHTGASAGGVSAGSNILLGAALHGLNRRQQNHELTPIKKIGVDLFDIMANSPEEIDMYSWSAGVLNVDAGRRRKFLNSLFKRHVEKPYDFDELVSDYKIWLGDTIKQPHIRVVTPKDMDESGSRKDTKEFKAACVERNRGVTVGNLPYLKSVSFLILS